MKKQLFLALLCIIMLASCGNGYKYEQVKGDPMGVRIYTLDNGLKVYMSVNKEQPRVTAHIAVNTGSKNDPAEYTGLAHYLEHLMFKGSQQFGTTDYEAEKPYIDKITALYEEYRTITDEELRRKKYQEIDSVSQLAAQYNIPNEYDKLMALIGGNGTNAYTSFDITCYTEDIPANEIDRWARIQADRFQNLVMRGFHTELEAVYEEKNISMASDNEKLFDAYLQLLFPTHSYGTQTTIGTQEHLKNPSLVAIQQYFDRYYRPNNVAIVLAGDFDPDKTIALIDKHFGSWQAGDDVSGRTFEAQPEFDSPRETFVLGQEQELLFMGWRFEGAASLQNDTLQMLSKVLTNGRAGVFDLNLNQKMAVQYAGAYALELKDYSTLMLQALPNPGQSLSEVRQLLLAEVEKVKRGEFDDDLLVSIVNNEKRDYLMGLDNNRNRVSIMVDAYINGTPWAQQVAKTDRLAKLKKEDIVAFANKHLTDGYAYVEKRQGEDPNVKKMDKPQITPIPANRDYASKWLTALSEETVEPIHPVFLDFNKELTFTEAGSLPVIYKQNKENDLFTLVYRFEFGSAADNRYDIAAEYLTLLGTKTLSSEELKKQFYKLACDYRITINEKSSTIRLTGLKENMPAAMALLEDVLQNSVADQTVYDQYVEQILKARADEKLEQRPVFNHLWQYALRGKNNPTTDFMTEQQLRNTNPEELVALIAGMKEMKHEVLYFGPATEKELASLIAEVRKPAANLADVPQNKQYEWWATPQNEVIIAPYEANNIYLRMLSQELKPLNMEQLPLVRLFNEYFGGGMNSIVFQELRETRGLAYNAGGAYITPSDKEDPEYSYLHIISQNDKMMDCINVFGEIVKDMPLNEAALDIARQNLLKTIAAHRTRNFSIINSYINSRNLGIDYDLNRVVYEALPSITMQDVLNFERENIAGKPMRYVILGNEKELDIKALEKIAPIKRVSINEIFGY